MIDRPLVLFFDQDHVLEVARLLIDRQQPDRAARLTGFFSPEVIDPAPLLARYRSVANRIVVASMTDGDVALADAQALFLRRGSVTLDMLEAMPKLKLVQRLGESRSSLDEQAVASSGVQFSCIPRRSLIHVAEHVLMFALALSRRLPLATLAIDNAYPSAALGNVSYNWAALSGLTTLHGKTFGIVGMGEIGMILAPRLRVLGAKILYHKRHRFPASTEVGLGIEYASLTDLLSMSDIVSLHCPPSPENFHLADADFFSAMKPGALVINTARGSILDEAALVSALRSGHIAGAALDVHESEPRSGGGRFAGMNNVILTPHIAGGSRSDVIPELAAMVENLEMVLDGRPIFHGNLSGSETIQ